VWNCNIWHWTRYGLAPPKPYDDDEDKMVRLADDQFTANLIESAQRQTADE
jgi:hypothetical protein